ncbi:glutathione S-transferase family protein [Tardiphaga sp.]|uniref:glutathione S-transferase family protein n=1 Tax=Tardiphaga sp. TaxID=1926292 RepID=UPI00352AF97B
MTVDQPDAPALTLVSHHLCPYVQRAAIVLAEKDVRFERSYIDLAHKPDWFHAVSPLGKVPLLLVRRDGNDTAAIFESAVICEYLEETQMGARLHPSDPLERAGHRGWIEFGSSILADLWGFETATEANSYEAKRKMLAGKFGRIENVLTAAPFFAGQHFSMVDAVYAPIFRYFDVFDTIADTEVFAQTPKVRAWRAALRDRPSVANAVTADYADRLRAFLAERDAHLLKIAA